jgi:phosphate transport system substrate-binding protein
MTWLQRRIGILILLALLCSVGILSAQESSDIIVTGSGIVAPVFEALTTANGATVSAQTTVTGTVGGFEAFCQGQVDVTLANRTITGDEANNCTSNSINYVEQLIAHEIIAFIAKADAAYTPCLTTANLSAIFPPSAEGQITNWNQVDPANGDLELSVIVPDSTTATFATLDNFIAGDGVRADASSEANDESVITAVAAAPGAIGVVNYQAAITAGDQIKILELNTNDVIGCAAPSTTTVEDRSYGAAESLYAYINKANLEKPGLKDIFRFISSDQATATLGEFGLSAPSATIYATNIASLEGTGETAPFSAETTSFQIPLDVNGNVAIAGATSGREYVSNMATRFTGIYTTVTVDVKTLGQPAGIRRLCNGEIDIALVDSDLTEEQNQNCAANNITTLPIDLGNEAVVLVGNGNSPYLACLSTEQLTTIWRAPVNTDATITNWNQLGGDFPDQAMTLFQPEEGDPAADLLLTESSNNGLPVRDDSEFNNDPLYRAAATANVEGALTYMNLTDYQKVVANNQERIQLVGVPGESGCVVPSEQTIADGTYPLTRSATLLVNQASLTKPPVQSFLWFLAMDENYPSLEQDGLTGVSFGSFASLRETLQKAYLDAAEVAAEATPEPSAEVTPEATPAS